MPSFKTTDDLFENVPVAQIETTLRQTRARAEAKKEELRQLVESRYKVFYFVWVHFKTELAR